MPPRHISRIGGAALLLCFGSAPSFAQDQQAQAQQAQAQQAQTQPETPPTSVTQQRTVAEQPRPFYDPQGIHLGSFLVLPKAELATAYDDNIYATEHEAVGDFFNRLTESVTATSLWSRHALDGTVTGRQTRYISHSTEDYDAASARLHGRIDATRDDYLDLTGIARRDADSRSELETNTDRRQRAMYNEFSGRAALNHRINRLNFSLIGEARDQDYDRTQDRDRSLKDYTVTGRASYDISPRFAGYYQSSYLWRDYAFNSSQRNSQTWTNMVGTTFDINGLFFGEFGIGVLNQTFDNPALSEFTGLALHSKVSWNVTPRTSFIGTLDRRDEATRVQAASTRVRTIAKIEAQQELYHDLLGRMSYAYENDDYRGLNLQQDIHTAMADVRYWVNRYVNVGASYTYIQRDASRTVSSSLNVTPFRENVVMMSVTGQF